MGTVKLRGGEGGFVTSQALNTHFCNRFGNFGFSYPTFPSCVSARMDPLLLGRQNLQCPKSLQ